MVFGDLAQPFYGLVPPNRPLTTESVTISVFLSAINSVSSWLICWSSAALPHSTHMPAAPIFNQRTYGAFPQDFAHFSVILPSPSSAQPSSAGGDRSCVDGQLASPLLSPAIAPLCATPLHVSPSFSSTLPSRSLSPVPYLVF